MSCNGCGMNTMTSRPSMLDAYDWIKDLPDTSHVSDIVEVRFKSTRKEYFKNDSNIDIKRGDWVVVACSPGHDVGQVTLTGYLAEKQYNRKIRNKERYEFQTIYRKASEKDKERWKKAQENEKPTMIRAREIAKDIGLEMKIGDVEYRGDGHKAIFYYIADGRVDFRELIKVYAKEFNVRIEMKQIGARQEAGRVGGIGSCGRELCCSSWRTDFDSISSEAFGPQGLSGSASKMAGACGKLKCCLLYELDNYIDAGKEFPKELLNLETARGIAIPQKTDYLAKVIWFSYQDENQNNVFKLTLDEIRDVIQKNKKGIKPEITKVDVDKKVDDHDFVLKSTHEPKKLRKKKRSNRRKRPIVKR